MNSQDIAQTYRETGAQGADSLELVAMLYDVLLDDLRRAIEALRACDIEKRTAEMQHAHRILEQLQGSLDLERGGEPARNLDRLYSLIRVKLLEAHWKSSEELLRRQIELLVPLRDAWKEARARRNAPAETPAVPNMPPPESAGIPEEWRV